ncbi:MAG: FHA domain-containing protein [Candidatus Faecivicinus sp.]
MWGRWKWKRALALCMALLLLAPAGVAGQTAAISVSRAVQVEDGLMLYANLLDGNGHASGESSRFDAADFTVLTGGNAALSPDSVAGIRDAGQGTHYVICVDVSASIKKTQMPRIVEALSSFFQRVSASMTVYDRISLYTFGDEIRLLKDTSADITGLINDARALSPTDQHTQLYEAIFTAVDKARTVSDSAPLNSMVILITDGTDDPNKGQENIYTYDSISRLVEEAQVPIYTLAVRQEGNQPLWNLMQFSDVSGGCLYLLDAEQMPAAMEQLRQLADETLLVHVPLTSDGSTAGAGVQEYRLVLNRDGASIQDEQPHRLMVNWSALPTPAPTASPEPSAAPSPAPTPTAVATPVPTPTPEPTPTAVPPTVPPTAAPTPEPTPEPTPVPMVQGWINTVKGMVNEDNIWFVYAAVFLLVALLVLIVLMIATQWRKKRDEAEMRFTVDSMHRDDRGRGSDQRTIRSDERAAEEYGNTIRAGGYESASSGGTIRLDDSRTSSGTIRIDDAETGVELTIEEENRRKGTSRTHTIFVETEIIVGRLESCDLPIGDETVSGRHMKILREVDGLYVRDLNSQNGTRVNGEPLQSERPLRSGDVLTIGRTTLKVYFED